MPSKKSNNSLGAFFWIEYKSSFSSIYLKALYWLEIEKKNLVGLFFRFYGEIDFLVAYLLFDFTQAVDFLTKTYLITQYI